MTYTLPPDDIAFIRNQLRQASVKWAGRAECLKRARKKVLVRHTKDKKPVYKFHWQCAKCRKWSRNEKEMEVDHVEEIGPFKGDWNEYLWRHFRRDNLQALCVVCHLKKTKAYNSAKTKWQRKK